MVETIDVKQNKIIDTVAQFLLVNSEVINSNGLKEKMPLIYFLFTYGKTFSKKNYTDFAFEILENLLIEEISVIEKHKAEVSSKIAGIGWSLMKFVEAGYFESDDLEDILELIDVAVLLDINFLIKKEWNRDYITDLIIHGHYIKERKKKLKNNSILLLKLDKAINGVLAKLNECSSLIDNKNYLGHVLCMELIKHEERDNKNLSQLKKHIEKYSIEKAKQTIFSTLIANKTYEIALVFNELYFKEINEFKTNKTIMLKEIKSNVNILMETLLDNEEKNYHQLFSKLIIQALFMCKEGKLRDHKLFVFGLINNFK